MSNIESHINEQFDHLRENLLVVACSGGLDSITLLYAFNKLGFNVKAAHVNYQLRGAESEKDAQFVSKFCTDHTIPFEVRALPLKKDGNVQVLAREARYNWFQEILMTDEQNRILLGHHRDDQIETFYLNLARNSGVMGLACMLENNNRIIRPLLSFSKQELEDYAKTEGFEWREDRSNAENKYRRNKLRNIILPDLKNEIPSLEESVLLIIDKMQELQADLSESIQTSKRNILASSFLPQETFNQFNQHQRIQLFRELGMDASAVSEVNSLTTKGTRVELIAHDKYKSIVKEKDGLFFEPLDKTKELPELIIEKVTQHPTRFTKNEIYLDADAIVGELKLRIWQVGDRIHPVGLDGSQLISAIIKDAQLRTDEKNETLVVEDAQNIHWCVGLKIGRKAIVNGSSTNMIKVHLASQKSPR